MIALRKILVATDFSEPSDAALMYGRELARTFDASLTLFHAVPHIAVFGGDVALFEPEAQQELEASSQRQLDALLSDEDRRVLRATAVLRTTSTPAIAIVDCAREIGADLIVIGTHGRSGVAHLVMGSVAERVVRTAPCPVLTVRHPEHEFVLPDALVAVARS